MSLIFLAFIAVLIGGCSYSPTDAYLKGIEAYNKGDYKTAEPLIRLSATNNGRDAMVVLGSMYLFGRGVPKNGQLAEEWLNKARDLGSNDAISILGMMYATGNGVPKNNEMAKDLLTFAADNGDDKAQQMLQQLAQQH